MKFLARFSIDGFMVAIFAALAVGTILPASGDAHDALKWVVKGAIALLFFLYGTRLSPREAFAGFRHWRLHSVVLAATFVFFPLIGLSLRILVPSVLSTDLYRGVLFLCLVPSTVQSSIAFTSIARGNVSAAIVSASFSNLLGVVATPLLVIFLMDATGDAKVDFSSVVDIVVQLVVPFVVGQLARPLVVGWVRRHAALTRSVDRGSILLVVYSAFSEGMNEHIWSSISPWQVVLLVLIAIAILAVVMFATAFAGRALGFSMPDRIVIIFCGSKKSLATGIPMASVLFAGQSVGLVVLPLMIFHQVQLLVCAWLAQRFARRPVDAPAAEPSPPAPVPAAGR